MIPEILYLCNRKNEKCKDSVFCYTDCFHTEYGSFALNGSCEDPSKEPERFDKYEYKDGKIFYVEKEKQNEH